MNNNEMERTIRYLENDVIELKKTIHRNSTIFTLFAQELGIGLDAREYEIVKLENEDDLQLTIREDVDFIQQTLILLLDHLSLEVQVDAKKEETFSLRNKNEG